MSLLDTCYGPHDRGFPDYYGCSCFFVWQEGDKWFWQAESHDGDERWGPAMGPYDDDLLAFHAAMEMTE